MDIRYRIAIFSFPGFASFILYPRLAMWLERKTLARIHARIGPLHAGRKGILQPLIDLLKVLGKILVIPKRSDKFIYVFAPQLTFLFLSVALLAMPIRPRGTVVQVAYSLLFVTAIFTAIPPILAISARSSANKYAVMGGARGIINFIGFETAKLVTVLSIARVVGSRDFSDVVARQAQHGRLLWYLPLAFITLIIITMVETERPPFDAPETEAEVAYGLATEYSGPLLAMRIATGYNMLFALLAFITAAFLGAYHGIGIGFIPENSVRRFILKLAILSRIVFLIRGGMVRYRPDQIVRYGRRIAMILAYLNLIRAAYLVWW